ncbi:MAG: hypothetical protein PHU97_00370 [Bacteroidales bacterium]|nr:hypothetical protein [Bacteroidales bacterium]MDD3009757.1 hypothetical protein [Bacteroidales bacterium]MDD3960613.1 hypothetical protein [Bacteroidales bacterium]MDY0286247.1 hypothetical protein [Bacteroidales bacterium]HPE86853.1 hypothetical protein [Bacteroidales bacterium]
MIHRRFIIFLIAMVLLDYLYGQEQKHPVTFTGSNRISLYSSNRQGIYTAVPQFYLENSFSSTLTLLGLPLSSSFFFYSEKNSGISPYFFYNIRIQRGLFRKEKFPEMPRWASTLIASTEQLEIGNTHPVYSPLILTGIGLRGINVAIVPGNLYLAFAHGTLQHAIHAFQRIQINSSAPQITYASIGYGKNTETHFRLSVLKAHDQKNTDATREENLRRENLVVGPKLHLSLFNKKWIFTAEGAASLLTRNSSGTALGAYLPVKLDFLAPVITLNATSQIDFAYRIFTHLSFQSTKISAKIQRIGSGYHTMGTPALRNDLFLADARITQTLFKKAITLTGSFQKGYDNLIQWKDYSTLKTSYSLSATYRKIKQPHFTIAYAPYNLYQQSLVSDKYVRTSLLTLSSGYTSALARCRVSSTVSFIRMLNSTFYNTTQFFLKTNTLSLTGNMRFPKSLVLYASANLSFRTFQHTEKNVYTYHLKVHYGNRGKWQNSLVCAWASHETKGEKLRLQYQSILPISKWMQAELTLAYNAFIGAIQPIKPGGEWISSLHLIVKW